MRWLNLGLWLNAWIVWAWLGVGLSRELPRQPGKPLCKLASAKDDRILGFIGDSNRVALNLAWRGVHSTIAVVDAESGERIFETPGPAVGDQLQEQLDPNHSDALFVGAKPEKGFFGWTGLFMLDLKSFEWRKLSAMRPDSGVGRGVSLHPEKPWVVFAVRESRGNVQRIVVVDYRTGVEAVFDSNVVWTNGIDAPQFIPGSDKLLVTASNLYPILPEPDPSAEIWRIADPPVLEKAIRGQHFGQLRSVSRNGLAAFGGLGRDNSVDVFDLRDERTVLADPPHDQRPTKRFAPVFDRLARLNASGTRLLAKLTASQLGSTQCPTLWNLEASKPIWKPNTCEWSSSEGDADHFCVTEYWSFLWKEWLPNLKYETRSIRRLEDGSLVLRTPAAVMLPPANFNKARTLAVSAEGEVYRLPLPMNWPLWALCQSILAVPLVLTWLAARWLNRRRLRRASLNLSASSPTLEPR